MLDPADQTAERGWVEQLRAAGVKFRRGTDHGELPFKSEVDFCPPACVGPEACEVPVEPEWVERLRAKGHKITTGTVGTPGLPYEPGVDFSPPAQTRGRTGG